MSSLIERLDLLRSARGLPEKASLANILWDMVADDGGIGTYLEFPGSTALILWTLPESTGPSWNSVFSEDFESGW